MCGCLCHCHCCPRHIEEEAVFASLSHLLFFVIANKRVDEKLYAPAIKELAGMGFNKVDALEAVFSVRRSD